LVQPDQELLLLYQVFCRIFIYINRWRRSKSAASGGVQGPLRTNTAGTAGSATVSGTVVTSGTFKDSVGVTQNVTSNTSGPTGVFNSSGNGATGSK
jgi:hypothetical protein